VTKKTLGFLAFEAERVSRDIQDRGPRVNFADPPSELNPIHLGHPNIGQKQVDRGASRHQLTESVRAINRIQNIESLASKNRAHGNTHNEFVIGE